MFRVLGGLEVEDDAGAPVDLGGRQPRLLLAVLLAAGRPVSADALVDIIWGDEPPASATGTLQSYVSRLRRRFGTTALIWDESGYRLDVVPDDVDYRRFEALADEGRSLLDEGRYDEAARVLAEAESLWRGPAFGELADVDFLRGLAVRLEERRVAALEDRMAAELALGHHASVVGELTALVEAHPLRERLRELLALALYRSGRQADALRSLADAGRTLRDELGIEPSRPLRDLETAILNHDPALDAVRSTPVETMVARLIGRDDELGELLAALDESAHDARFVVVEGEPGIGKTRLVDELGAVARERGALAVWGRSDESGAAPALWPWLGPLRAMAAKAGAMWVTELLSGQGHAAAPLEQFEAVGDLIDSLTAEQTVVVMLDDLQWADVASLELLAYLVGRAGPRLLVVGTMRRLEVGRRDALTDTLSTVARRVGSRRLSLRGLNEEETAAVLAGAVDRDTAGVIHARAEGNPFYAIELARLIGQEGSPGDVPGSVADVIRRRLAHLPPSTVDLLGVAAVAGRDVELGLLARAADLKLDECVDTIEPAVVHRLLAPVPELPSVFRFSHALVREVLLDDLSALRRARLHLRVADAIEAGGAGVDDAEILAEHLFQAAPVGGGKRAAEALERAAEVAVRRASYGAAEGLLKRAVQLRRVTAGESPDGLDAELSAILRLIEVARSRRYYAGASELDILDRAKELADRGGHYDVALDLLWLDHAIAATTCDLDVAQRYARQLLDMTSDDPDPARRSKGLLAWGTHCWQRGRISESVEYLVQGRRQLLDGNPVPANELQLEQLMLAETFTLFMQGLAGQITPGEAMAGYDQLTGRITDRFGLASVLGFQMSAAVALGLWEVVERLVDRSEDVNPGTEFTFWTELRGMHRAIVLAWRGKVDEAMRDFAVARETFTGIGSHSTLAALDASLALHVALAGRDEGAALAAQARRELEAYGDRWGEPVVLMAEAAVALQQGDTDEAQRLFAEAEALAEGQGAPAMAARARALASTCK